MTIQFKCQSCGKALKVDESKAGKRVKCPGCMEVITIPVPKPEVEDEFDLGGYDDGYGDDDDELDTPPRRTAQKAKPKAKPKKKRAKRISSVDAELAPRYRRLLGSIADSLAIICCLIPGFLMIAAMGNANQQHRQQPSPAMSILALAVLFLGFMAPVIINICLYATRSQSIGKYLMRTQVVDYESGEPAGVLKGFFLRNVGILILHCVPFGALADALFIFGEENRCIHDHIASTSVVDIS